MKRSITLLFALLILVFQGISQPKSQRLILVEEFTNASCGPCAAANPAFNDLLQQPDNFEKVVAIKYQTNWPGVDPMNAQTQTDVGPRVTYYGVTGVPDATMDGNVWQDHPANFTQTQITNEYAVSSPYTMDVTHHLSDDYDSIYITVVVSATATVTGNLVLHTAILEDRIDFESAPGSNGETEFFNVMRKMLPNASGTTLPGTWANGDVQTYNFALALPSFIYNLDQISVIAWVQDNANKNVKQAGVSRANTVGADLAVVSISGFPEMTCALPISGLAVVQNTGTMDVTSCVVKWQTDNGTVDSLVWTGTLAPGDTFQVPFNGMNPAFGSHEFKVWVASLNNGAMDIHATNNRKIAGFIVANQSFPSPIASGFEPTAFPPTNWFVVNPGGDTYKWNRFGTAGGFGQSLASARIQFYSIPEGDVDEFYLAPVDLSAASAAVLTFNLAHARYSAQYIDRLKVQVSSDCGLTWATPYDKSDPALATTTTLYTAAYVPTAAQWRAETVDMNAYAGQQQVMVKFVALSGYGNNLYIDDVNLTTAVGIHEKDAATSVEIYPNPVNNAATVNLNLANSGTVSLEVYNAFGQMVYSRDLGNMAAGQYNTTFDGSNLNSGLYYMNVILNGEKIVKKFSVAR
ncbi:MAG: T9SS type A sorting domain-containing protein [Bacteroidales bacterium]